MNGQSTKFVFDWRPLTIDDKKCYVWLYKQAKSGSDLPIVYRHVLDVPKTGVVTVYVGEGESLNGPTYYNLVFQYSGHGETRKRVKAYLISRHEAGWADILELTQPILDLSDQRLRKFVEDTFISVYFWEHQRLSLLKSCIPDFLNQP